MSTRRAFVVGCQRSGTTLFRFLLGARSDVRSIDEEAAYPILTGQANEPDVEPGTALVVYKIPRYAEQLLQNDVRDELFGTSPQFYRREHGVFIVRDPRDVIASMCSLRAGNEASWISVYGRAMLEHRIAERTGFAERYAAELEELAQRGWPDHLIAALYWRVRNEALEDYVSTGLPLLPVCYEQLVQDPGPHLQRICAHLQLPFDERMLHHQDEAHDQLDAQGLAIGNSDPKRAIDATSVGRFRDKLAPEAVAEIEARTATRHAELLGISDPR